MRGVMAAFGAAMACLLTVGCDGGGYDAGSTPKAPVVTQMPKPAQNTNTESPPTQSGMTAGMQAAGTAIGMAPMDLQGGPSGVAPARPVQTPPSQPAAAPDQKPGTIAEKAEAGAGKKGRGYGGGIITEPIRQYFRAEQRITFQRVEEAASLYNATNGSSPKDFKELEEKVLKPNNLKLPELPEGHRYLWDPKRGQWGELLVEKPE